MELINPFGQDGLVTFEFGINMAEHIWTLSTFFSGMAELSNP